MPVKDVAVLAHGSQVLRILDRHDISESNKQNRKESHMQTVKPFFNLELIESLNTEELEVFIDACYETHVPQEQLALLETIYAGRISEDELLMTEDEPSMSEAHDMGVDLEEWLAQEYFEYIHPNRRIGLRDSKDYFNPSCFDDFLYFNPKPGLTRKMLKEAARDIYERKRSLVLRYRSLNKINTIPKNLIS
ncbi:MAG: hypothetical protein KGJ11_00885 [Candidatus Omnitrophica bacterium]|nr:hypothetical protein [Candidatus Omnitrophota bacterium]